MAVNYFLNNILLLEVHNFEGFSNWYKNDGMVNIYAKAATIVVNLKNLLILLKIISNIVFDFIHTYQLNY